MEAGIQACLLACSAISIAGANKLQKLAAIITPAAKPSMLSKTFLFIFLKKNTTEAPKAVTNHVKQVASSACIMGLSPLNQVKIMMPPYITNISLILQ
jgi:hypothetical protein